MDEKGVEEMYHAGTSLAEKELRTNGITDNFQLGALCKKHFGAHFLGVFAQDTIPWKKMKKKRACCIFNLDLEGEPGSHWCALYTSPDESYPILYDSFGRSPQMLLKRTKDKVDTKKIRTTESDAEQEISETNCGARCFGFLYMCHEVEHAQSIFLL